MIFFHRNSLLSIQKITQSFSRLTSTIIPFKLGDIGEGIRDVELKEWYVEIGDQVKEFDRICEVQSDKANFTITSRFTGTILKLYHKVNGTATVGKPLVDIELPPGVNLSSRKKKTTIISDDTFPNNSAVNILATPTVRQLAKELRISLNDVQGTGKDGRILAQDLVDFRAEKTISKKFSSLIAPRSPTSVKQSDLFPSVFSIKPKSSNSHLTFCDEYDFTKLMQIKHQSYFPFMIKACSQLLNQFPILNSTNDSTRNHQIGITIQSLNGFQLANIKNVEQLSIVHIENEIKRLEQLARTNQLAKQDLSQTYFSLTNLGRLSGTYAMSSILSSQLVVGSLGKITKNLLPSDDDDEYRIRSIMPISWSVDHRKIDSNLLLKFSKKLKFLLENPYAILLN